MFRAEQLSGMPAQLTGSQQAIDARLRRPLTQLTVLRDLIDIRAALHAGGVETPVDLQTTIEQMAPMLRMFRHGDGGLALFNGAQEGEGWQVETVLQRAGGRPRALSLAPQSGFQRLQAGRTVVLIDAGRPPPPTLAREAHAGTLSFELSIGRQRLIVNCGTHPAGHRWSRAYRASAAHSTLVVNDTNSSKISADGALSRVLGWPEWPFYLPGIASLLLWASVAALQAFERDEHGRA